MLRNRDTYKGFELEGDLLKMITNKNYEVDLAISQYRKLLFDFAEEMYFDERASGDKRISTILLPKNPAELCDRTKLLLQGKQAGNNSDIINEEIVAKADKLLEYKCISTKQHIFMINKILN